MPFCHILVGMRIDQVEVGWPEMFLRAQPPAAGLVVDAFMKHVRAAQAARREGVNYTHSDCAQQLSDAATPSETLLGKRGRESA
eukprot:419639-Pleurochrysis_carterae.AAC.3